MAWSQARPQTGFPKKPRLDEEIDVYQFPPNKYIQVRYIGPFNSYVQGWLRVKSSKGGYVKFPKICLDYDPKKQKFTRNICPYRAADVYMPQHYIANMIVRRLQRDKPKNPRAPRRSERKRRLMLGERWFIKDVESRTFTPVRVHNMPAGLADKLANLSAINKVKVNGKRKAYDISDPDYGMDVLIRYNPKAAGAAKWDVQRADQVKLTKNERDSLIYNLENLPSLQPEDKKTAREEWKRIEKIYRPEKRKGKDGKSTRDSGRSERSGGRKERNKKSNKRERNSDRRDRGSSKKHRSSIDDLDDLD